MELNKPLASFVILIVILTAVFAFIMPKYNDLVALKDTTAKKQAEYDGLSLYYTKIDETLKAIDSKQELLAKVDSSLPTDPSVAPLIYFFQQKSNETGILLKSLTFSQNVGASGPALLAGGGKAVVKDIKFSLDLLGNYAGIKNFLAALETSSRLIEVDSINLNPQSADTKSGAATFSFKIEVRTHTY